MINQSTNQTYTLSKLQMYDECPQKYKLCYLDRVHILENLNKTNQSSTGTNLHTIINAYLKGQNVEKMLLALTPNEKILWANFKNNEISKLKYIVSEYSFNIKIDEYWLTGRIDALFQKNNEYIIYDWKTGENFKQENVKYQTAFYLLSLYEILKAKNYLKTPEQLSLIYLNILTNDAVKINFNSDLYIQHKKQILETINNINDNKTYFCNKSDKCKYCKYYSVCPYY